MTIDLLLNVPTPLPLTLAAVVSDVFLKQAIFQAVVADHCFINKSSRMKTFYYLSSRYNAPSACADCSCGEQVRMHNHKKLRCYEMASKRDSLARH